MNNSEVENCKSCKKKFLIIPQELSFYERKNLPLPKNCHICRKNRKRSLRNERKLYKRTCDKCDIDLTSTYPKNSEFIVYCEKCYFKEV